MEMPAIHLNGSSAKRLLDDARRAYDALLEAEAALREMSPHPRDYYVKEEGAFGRAEREHNDRMDKIASVRDEIGTLSAYLIEKL